MDLYRTRIKLILRIFILTTAVGSATLVSCNKNNDTSSFTGAISKARDAGRRDALEFDSLYNSRNIKTLQLQEYLVNVRHKETRLREEGFSQAADSYIDAFKSTLAQNDSTLYNELFAPQPE